MDIFKKLSEEAPARFALRTVAGMAGGRAAKVRAGGRGTAKNVTMGWRGNAEKSRRDGEETPNSYDGRVGKRQEVTTGGRGNAKCYDGRAGKRPKLRRDGGKTPKSYDRARGI